MCASRCIWGLISLVLLLSAAVAFVTSTFSELSPLSAMALVICSIVTGAAGLGSLYIAIVDD
jgi:hypothetical protein